MRRRELIGGLVVAAAGPLAARAQVPVDDRRIGLLPSARRVGVLFAGRRDAPRSHEFFDVLKRLGHIEGGNVVYDIRAAQGDAAKLSQLARDMVAKQPDVIVSSTSVAARALADATATIPIVMALISDPLDLGLTESMSRPTGNVTGFTASSATLAAKRLELLRELMPSARRVAHLSVPASPHALPLAMQARQAAGSLGMEVVVIPLRSAEDIAPAFAIVDAQSPDALLIDADPITITQRHALIDECRVRNLPAIHTYALEVRDGGLISYGPSSLENFVGAAEYADRILRGAKVAELPFEEPTHFTLAVNLRSARSLGLIIPPTLLARADEVIE